MKRNRKTKNLQLNGKNSFESLFSQEIYSNERFRALVLISLLLLESVLLMTVFCFYYEKYLSIFNSSLAFYATLIFSGVIGLYELAVHYFFLKKIRRDKFNHKQIFGYVNSFVEISLISVSFIFIVKYTDQMVILHAPATLTYFLLIVLSTLRLDFRKSVFVGMVSAIEYISVSVYFSTYYRQIKPDIFNADLSGIQYLGQGIILIVSGIAAGFVADLINKKLKKSIKTYQEKTEIIGLFGQQISYEIAESILNSKDELVGKNKKVCVMFLDIRNFTKFAENNSPEEVVNYLNKLFDFMIEIVQKHGGVINQFLGDGFMATFGAPVKSENISQKATDSASEIITKLNAENKKGNIPETRVGIGLHSGEALIGNIGSANRKQYSITGSVVIISSRIEQLNKIYNSQLIISEEVYNELETETQKKFGQTKSESVKGISKPVNIFILNEN